MEKPSGLQQLVGEQLGSVTFVQDYLQLDFDGRTLTLNIWPEIDRGSNHYTFGDAEYRNTLCGFIAKRVTSVNETEFEIEIGFADGTFRVDLAAHETLPIERVVFHDTVEDQWAWW